MSQRGRGGSIGHSKHRKAFGTSPVNGAVKAAVEREANRLRKKRRQGKTYASVSELMKEEGRR